MCYNVFKLKTEAKMKKSTGYFLLILGLITLLSGMVDSDDFTIFLYSKVIAMISGSITVYYLIKYQNLLDK